MLATLTPANPITESLPELFLQPNLPGDQARAEWIIEHCKIIGMGRCPDGGHVMHLRIPLEATS